MARGRHYAKLSLSNAARLSFSDLCILLFMFLSLCRLCVCVFLCSHWSLVDVPLIFFCPADHVPDWQPRVLLGMVEARSVNVKKTTTTTTKSPDSVNVIYCCTVYGHTYSKSMDQPGKVAGPARGQLTRYFPCPRSHLIIWSRETGSAVPSRVSLLILLTRAKSGASLRDSSRVPRRRIYIFQTAIR